MRERGDRGGGKTGEGAEETRKVIADFFQEAGGGGARFAVGVWGGGSESVDGAEQTLQSGRG